MAHSSINETFRAALDALVEEIKRDHTVLAVILCGSLSHDTVWAKSDIDLALVTIDDKKADRESLALYADGVNVHAFLMQRAKFRQLIEGTTRNSFMHSLLAKGRLLYTHDESIVPLFESLQHIGERDRQIQLLRAAMHALGTLYKAHKWFITREDLDYTSLWLIYLATPLAQIEVLQAKQLIGREVILQATAINPDFFRIIYTDLLNTKKTKKAVKAALDAVDSYIADRVPVLFPLVLEHLRDAGEARSCTEIDHYFLTHFGIEGGGTTACEYLADQGIIAKVSLPVRLTGRSNLEVQEMAFFTHG